MRVHVGRIGYRVSDKLSKILPASCVHSLVNAKLAVIRELPGSRRTIKRILSWIDFGISASTPETDEARDEKMRQEEKRNKKMRSEMEKP